MSLTALINSFLGACTGISKNVIKDDINADLTGLVMDESQKPTLVYII
ncbi:hypothetical protein ACOBV9_19490 (plasmid) [Pseudoalteromonas espejiana]